LFNFLRDFFLVLHFKAHVRMIVKRYARKNSGRNKQVRERSEQRPFITSLQRRHKICIHKKIKFHPFTCFSECVIASNVHFYGRRASEKKCREKILFLIHNP
jgi:hypothetical protein